MLQQLSHFKNFKYISMIIENAKFDTRRFSQNVRPEERTKCVSRRVFDYDEISRNVGRILYLLDARYSA